MLDFLLQMVGDNTSAVLGDLVVPAALVWHWPLIEMHLTDVSILSKLRNRWVSTDGEWQPLCHQKAVSNKLCLVVVVRLLWVSGCEFQPVSSRSPLESKFVHGGDYGMQ